ncbi:MAG: hypothetical protein ACNA8W_08295 [Bradymonadaceae bacterium]
MISRYFLIRLRTVLLLLIIASLIAACSPDARQRSNPGDTEDDVQTTPSTDEDVGVETGPDDEFEFDESKCEGTLCRYTCEEPLCNYRCPPGFVCTYECSSHFKCNIQCTGARCVIGDCTDCEIDCRGGECLVRSCFDCQMSCSEGAECDLDCTAGCELNCDGAASCTQRCPGTCGLECGGTDTCECDGPACECRGC